jgi:hypothetical protein
VCSQQIDVTDCITAIILVRTEDACMQRFNLKKAELCNDFDPLFFSFLQAKQFTRMILPKKLVALYFKLLYKFGQILPFINECCSLIPICDSVHQSCVVIAI